MFVKNALVAAAALVASVAVQAQSVNVYGNLDLALASWDNGNSRTTAIDSGVLTGSFLGFKGQEDLGGGLKAFFALESQVAADTGAAAGATFWNRTSELGLATAYGTATIGNSVALAARAANAQSPFSVHGMLGLSTLNVGIYQKNSLTFTSANYSGITAAAQYGASEGAGDGIYAAQVNFAQGPVAAGLTYTDIGNDSLLQIGGSYDMGAAKLFAQFATTDETDTDQFHIGAAAPISAAGSVHATFTHTKAGDDKSNTLALGYDHALSKRTGAYAAVVFNDQDNSDSTVSLAVGLRHAF